MRTVFAFAGCVLLGATLLAQQQTVEYRVLATNKTSTMEKELNEAADGGYRFQQVMGGDSAIGGQEVVIIMSRVQPSSARYSYRLLATARTSTMQRELQSAADAGFAYRGQTVFTSAFGGDEVVVILERDSNDPGTRFDYRLIATTKTSTLEKELLEAGRAGYDIVGMTVGNTAVGGKELVAITRRPR
jgi:hypothetical protein